MKNEKKMNLFGKNLDDDVVIIAEIGVNHEGDVEAASRLLALAAENGADAIKFQTFSPERYASASNPERLARVRGFDLGEDNLRRLTREAEGLGVHIFSTPVSEDVVPLLDELFPAFKIASGDLVFEPVIRAAAATGKPVILSTGLGTLADIETAIGWVRHEVGEENLRDRLILMHCVSAYPTPIEEANVLSVPYLAEQTGLRVGYSNHVIGLEACYAAIALGACVIEVHFTDCKTGRDFRDHEISCDPDDLRALVDAAPRIRASLGQPGKECTASERVNLVAARKGVVAARDLDAGTVLAGEDLMFARPGTEFLAAELPELIGQKILRATKYGEQIERDNIGGSND